MLWIAFVILMVLWLLGFMGSLAASLFTYCLLLRGQRYSANSQTIYHHVIGK
jgi:hypothetical protein